MSTSSSPLSRSVGNSYRAQRPFRLRGRVLGAAAALTLVCAVAGCTPAPPGGASATPSAARSSAAAPAPGTTGESSSTSPSPSGLTIDITIANGKVEPNAEKIDVAQGTTVTLNVTSDADDEIHAHTAGDGYEIEVKAGEPATGSFVAADTGSFEIESHHLDKVIAILNVR